MLELGEELFDGVQVGRVFGQEERSGAGRTDGAAQRLVIVAAEVVHDHDVAGTQRGQQHLFDAEAEAFAIDGPVDQPWSCDLIMRGQQYIGAVLSSQPWSEKAEQVK